MNLQEKVFKCFDARCKQEGDVIDLWAAVHDYDMRKAVIESINTFGLEPAPATATEQKVGYTARWKQTCRLRRGR